MFILATVSCVVVIVSLVHFLMALAANYAHIRGHDKFTELQVAGGPCAGYVDVFVADSFMVVVVYANYDAIVVVAVVVFSY